MTFKQSSQALISGPIAPTLISLAAPMLLAILSMMSFNLIDTFFIAKLGTPQLAALTLTFPVVMVISMFTIGLGVGAMAVISQSIGGKQEAVAIKRLTTDSLSLALLSAAGLTALAMATVDPLFKMLGATGDILPYVKQYMAIWYPGLVFYVVPMIGGNIIRSTGDTLTPSLLMIGSMAINAALDPLFIFGWGFVPHMGIAGAAMASLVSRGLMLFATLWVLLFREKLLINPWPGKAQLLSSWKAICAIGVPVAVSNAIIPIALGFISRIVIHYGPAAIAGFGVATRIEAFALTPVFALSNGISPFVGQNIGAKKFDRIQSGLSITMLFSVCWGSALFALFLIAGKTMASVFNAQPEVTDSAVRYLWIVSIGLGLRGVHQIAWTALNVMGRPYDALILELFLAFGLWAPFSYFGSHIAGTSGIYAGLSVANIIAGIVAWIWTKRIVKKKSENLTLSP
jgi:putative MATE family efflux protein